MRLVTEGFEVFGTASVDVGRDEPKGVLLFGSWGSISEKLDKMHEFNTQFN